MPQQLRVLILVALLAPTLALALDDAAAGGRDSDAGEFLSERQVPPRVMATAGNDRPGAYFTHITRRLSDEDNTFYVFYASRTGRYFVITVRADGTLVSSSEEHEAPRF